MRKGKAFAAAFQGTKRVRKRKAFAAAFQGTKRVRKGKGFQRWKGKAFAVAFKGIRRWLELRQAIHAAVAIRGLGPHKFEFALHKLEFAVVKLESASLEFYARPLLVQLDLYLRRRMKK